MIMIKWAEYISKDNIIYIPHYSWDFNWCDCDRYLIMSELKKIYDNRYFKYNKDNYIEYDNQKYYYSEYEAVLTKDLELISNISDLYLER